MTTLTPMNTQYTRRYGAPLNKRLHTWLKRGMIGLLIASGGLVALGATYQVIATARDKRLYPPPGQRVDVGGYKLHIYCTGAPSADRPTVILDTLGDGTSVNWAWVQPRLEGTRAKATQVCAYDRAGRGWSDPSPQPRDAQHIAQELHTLLANASIPGPYVLVGHSFGGFVTRVYAHLYPDEVAGMVIVDGGQPDIRSERYPAEARAEAEAENRLMAMGPYLARLGLFRLLGNPAPDLPAQQRAQWTATYGATGLWDSINAEQRLALPITDRQVRNTGSLGDRPLMVVNGNTPMDEARRVYNELEAELLTLSTNSVRRIVDGASHGSLVFNREHARQTSAAILEVVEAARMGTPLKP